MNFRGWATRSLQLIMCIYFFNIRTSNSLIFMLLKHFSQNDKKNARHNLNPKCKLANVHWFQDKEDNPMIFLSGKNIDSTNSQFNVHWCSANEDNTMVFVSGKNVSTIFYF